jgi:hypothetical protein
MQEVRTKWLRFFHEAGLEEDVNKDQMITSLCEEGLQPEPPKKLLVFIHDSEVMKALGFKAGPRFDFLSHVHEVLEREGLVQPETIRRNDTSPCFRGIRLDASKPVDPLPIEVDTGLRDDPCFYRASKKPKIQDEKGVEVRKHGGKVHNPPERTAVLNTCGDLLRQYLANPKLYVCFLCSARSLTLLWSRNRFTDLAKPVQDQCAKFLMAAFPKAKFTLAECLEGIKRI